MIATAFGLFSLSIIPNDMHKAAGKSILASKMTDQKDNSDNQPPSAAHLHGVALIKAKAKTLPAAPGVYRMLGADDAPLYIGKARNLKARVASYTRLSGHSNRIASMINLTQNMEFIRTRTEADALLLEANLIRKFQPRFNVLLRDDKSLPYILLAHDHAVPQLTKHRGAQKRKGDYFGPFASVGAVNKTLNTLQKAFLLRSCTDSFYNARRRPCMLYQIKRCAAPCTGEIAPDDYALLVKQAQSFLSGANSQIQAELAAQMQKASAAENYELAARYRDRIRALTYVQSKTDIFARTIEEADIITLAQKGRQSCVQVFFFRAGTNLGNKAYFPRHGDDTPPEEVLESFIIQFYEKRPPCPHILVSHKMPQARLIEDALSLRLGKKVRVTAPQRGEKHDLVIHGIENAQEALARRLNESAGQRKLLEAVGALFDMDAPPERIEVFDNSHLHGTHQIGGMIVATREGFVKNQYRKFNIKNTKIAGDDYGMMREVLTRRYGRMLREEESGSPNRPDLILIDGGKGHLHIAAQIMGELGLDNIPLIGVAKGANRNAGQEKFFTPQGKTIKLPDDSPVLYYLQRLRDEAHRFAITGHRAARQKAMRSNPLDNVPGIGARRKKALMLHFGSAKAVMRASRADLEKVDGVSGKIAQDIYDYFNDESR